MDAIAPAVPRYDLGRSLRFPVLRHLGRHAGGSNHADSNTSAWRNCGCVSAVWSAERPSAGDGSMIDTAIREAAEEAGTAIAPEEQRSATSCTTRRPTAGWCCQRSVDGRGVKHVDHVTGIFFPDHRNDRVSHVSTISGLYHGFMARHWGPSLEFVGDSSSENDMTVRCAAAATADNYYFDRDGFASR